MPIPEFESGVFVLRHRHCSDVPLPMHLLESMDHAGDLSLFRWLHTDVQVPVLGPLIGTLVGNHGSAVLGDRLKVDRHYQRYHAGADRDAHLLTLEEHARLRFLGRLVPGSEVILKATFCGPGGLRYLRFSFPEEDDPVTDLVIVQSFTPVAPRALHVEYACYGSERAYRSLILYLVDNIERALRSPHPRDPHRVRANRRFYQQFCRPPARGDFS